MIACGELNIDILKSNMLTEKYLDIIEANERMMLRKHATHVTH